MPLPKTPVKIHFLDKDSRIVDDVVFKRRETGYEASAEYYPTMRAVKCSKCGEIGVCEFLGGLNLKEADRVMDGKSIRGTCMKCGKMVDLVPLPVNDPQNKQTLLYYQIQESLTEAAKRGERLGPTGMIWPMARVNEWERWKRGEAAGR
jgi:hypothetical protein